ncbi:hypothetical protein FNL39_1031 [Nocardia caishijiensis]|uniref:HTH-type transcriptional repressor Sco4008 C-terminal domain-containing protein n=1 Tax=Nocardia caishijiensis TaxID=184756 RepID=A0ABQ6YMU3_9NOCA|nr:hypothetical protein [Nocardia caishijiensis]KAF0847104.1 hypothetical protein FNL39_1031 [Nocardia caishijiensis]
MRFLMWYHLLRGEFAQRASVAESMRAKVEAIEQAQRRGTVTTAPPATHILALVLGLLQDRVTVIKQPVGLLDT